MNKVFSEFLSMYSNICEENKNFKDELLNSSKYITVVKTFKNMVHLGLLNAYDKIALDNKIEEILRAVDAGPSRMARMVSIFS